MSTTLDLLLNLDPPSQPTCKVKIKRLSQLCGEPVEFELRALSYSRVAEIKDMTDQTDTPVQILLSGVVSPDLKNRKLLEKYGVPTPAELVKKMLLPGEVEDLSRQIEHLSGYRENTLEEVEKN